MLRCASVMNFERMTYLNSPALLNLKTKTSHKKSLKILQRNAIFLMKELFYLWYAAENSVKGKTFLEIFAGDCLW